MMRLAIVLIISWLQFLAHAVRSQAKDSTGWSMENMERFFLIHSPLDYLEILKADFKRKGKGNVNLFGLASSPKDWVKEEHIPALLKQVYSTDSTNSIISVFSSFLTKDKYSTVGREAQNLIECFREKKSYPAKLNSFGPTDKAKGKELEDWWIKYKPTKP